MQRILCALTLVATSTAMASFAPAADFLDRYGDWSSHTDPQGNNYHQCKYTYKTKNGGDGIQYVIWYPSSAPRKNYYYWTKDGVNYWGKCVCQKSPDYNPAKMQWYTYTRTPAVTITVTLPLGDCPSPGDADEDDGIVKIPPPPGA